jgi:hypothetical protein
LDFTVARKDTATLPFSVMRVMRAPPAATGFTLPASMRTTLSSSGTKV